MTERYPIDCVRYYLIEAMSISRTGNDGRTRDHAGSLFCGSYLTTEPSPTELLTEGQFRLSKVAERLVTDGQGLNALSRDVAYLQYRAPQAAETIREKIKSAFTTTRMDASEFFKWPQTLEASKLHAVLRGEQDAVRRQLGLSVSAMALQQAARELDALANTTRFELDRRRLGELARAMRLAESYCAEGDFQAREMNAARCQAALSELEREIIDKPTRVSFEDVLKVVRHFKEILRQDFEGVEERSKPTLDIRDVLSADFYSLDSQNGLTIRLEVSVPRGCSPVEQIDIEALEEDGLSTVEPAISPQPLRGGDSRVMELRIKPSSRQIDDLAFTIKLKARYRYRGDQPTGSQLAVLPIRLEPTADFVQIPNPYHSYSGGIIVFEEEMFFGRRDLVQRILTQVAYGPGQCFVLYGQKRSGKSSVLHHVAKQLGTPNLPVSITLGGLEGNGQAAEFSFMRLIVDRLREILEDEHGIFVNDWPSIESLREQPMATFKAAVREAKRAFAARGSESLRIVLLIDEFTYLYEYLKEGIIERTFMRQWKAMLETKLFSAVVVGQDSMPQFKREFANEFGVTHDERISYLAQNEARDLADRPILLGDGSRYRGNALNRLLVLAACSPFYMQILCDHLVRHLNRSRAPFVTEADVEMVERRLTVGNERLPIEKFDPLITAAGESVAMALRSDYERILGSIAAKSQDGFGAPRRDLPQVPEIDRLLSDMVEREVLRRDSEDRYQIRVGLFASWLRANWVNIADMGMSS